MNYFLICIFVMLCFPFYGYSQFQLVPDPGFENTPPDFSSGFSWDSHWSYGSYANLPGGGYSGSDGDQDKGKPLLFNPYGYCSQRAIVFDDAYSTCNSSCYPGPAGYPAGYQQTQCFSNAPNIWGPILPKTNGKFIGLYSRRKLLENDEVPCQPGTEPCKFNTGENFVITKLKKKIGGDLSKRYKLELKYAQSSSSPAEAKIEVYLAKDPGSHSDKLLLASHHTSDDSQWSKETTEFALPPFSGEYDYLVVTAIRRIYDWDLGIWGGHCRRILLDDVMLTEYDQCQDAECCYDNYNVQNSYYFDAVDFPCVKNNFLIGNNVDPSQNVGDVTFEKSEVGNYYIVNAGNSIQMSEGFQILNGTNASFSVDESGSIPGVKILKTRTTCETEFCAKLCFQGSGYYSFIWNVNGTQKFTQSFKNSDNGPFPITLEVRDQITGKKYNAKEIYSPRYMTGDIQIDVPLSLVTYDFNGQNDEFIITDGNKDILAYNANYFNIEFYTREGLNNKKKIRKELSGANYSNAGFFSGAITWDLKSDNGDVLPDWQTCFWGLKIGNCSGERNIQGNFIKVTPGGRINADSNFKLNDLNSNLIGTPFPNPADDFCEISLIIAKEVRYSANITSSIGKEVLKLESEEIISAGNHRIAINTKGLPSGIYYINFLIDGYRESRKLVVL